MNKYKILTGAIALSLSSFASASTYTTTSATSKGEITAAITEVGGVVVDLVGLNGTRVTSQLSASSLFEGYSGSSNPLLIGTQTGFDNSITGLLGGGLSEAAFRFTLDDGDSAPGNFDDAQQNELLVNGISFGYWGETLTQHTDSVGNELDGGALSLGFSNNELDTGWFYSNETTTLSSLFSNITSTEAISFALLDVDPNDNYYDFTGGIDGSLINIDSGPVITSAVPEPSTYALMLAGLGLIGFMARRRKQNI
ncbi:MAG: PEP-CTERM sorting domain-containing protein [Thiotrichales bacterium]|nr:PEP-CTERM sorting domain-containing protein [Thiotrichales bacterium]